LFESARAVCPNLKIIEITVKGENQNFSKMLLQSRYTNNCMTSAESWTKYLPVKIAFNLPRLEPTDFKYPEFIEYLHFRHVSYNEPNDYGWEDYKNKFKKFPNLRGISLNGHTEQNLFDKGVEWVDRIAYLKTYHQIRIMTDNEIQKNEDLEFSIAKRLKINWIFRFVD
jgi:hypothetical protein